MRLEYEHPFLVIKANPCAHCVLLHFNFKQLSQRRKEFIV